MNMMCKKWEMRTSQIFIQVCRETFGSCTLDKDSVNFVVLWLCYISKECSKWFCDYRGFSGGGMKVNVA